MYETANFKKYSKKERKDLEEVISIIAMNYRDNKRILLCCSFRKPTTDTEIRAFKDNAWIESSYKMLDERYQPIIEVDVLKRFNGANYRDMMSESHYYRYKYPAYDAYKKILEK